MEKSNKSILIIDNGSYCYVAAVMAKYFTTVRYWSPWICGYPYIGPKKIGDGFEGVERVDYYEDWIDDTDIFIFPDTYYSGVANRLRKDGKKVFGSGDLELIERNREDFIDALNEAGLAVPPGETIEGLEKAIKFLKDKKDIWVKLSEWRGTTETFHWISETYTEQFINSIKVKYGPYGPKDNEGVFIMQLPIKTEIEYGIDNRMVNGVLPEDTFFGFEEKGCNYIIRMDSNKNLPKGLREVNEKFEKITRKYKYTGLYSTEVRVEEKTGINFFIDITPRAGLPPSASMLHMCDNWGEVILAAVNGESIPLHQKHKYCVEVLVTCGYKDNWMGWGPIKFDDKFKDNIYPCYCSMVDGIYWRVPNYQLYSPSDMLCCVVGEGDTLEKAEEHVSEILKTLEGIQIDYTNDVKEKSPKILTQLAEVTGYKF